MDRLGSFHTHVEDTGSAETSYTDSDVKAKNRHVSRIHALNGDDKSPRSTFFNADTPEVTDPRPKRRG